MHAAIVLLILILTYLGMIAGRIAWLRFDPRPFAIALAAATNAGSAATLIGNPQNIVLGAMGHLGFWTFLAINGVPALFALGVVFTVVWLQWRRRIRDAIPPEERAPPPVTAHA